MNEWVRINRTDSKYDAFILMNKERNKHVDINYPAHYGIKYV